MEIRNDLKLRVRPKAVNKSERTVAVDLRTVDFVKAMACKSFGTSDDR